MSDSVENINNTNEEHNEDESTITMLDVLEEEKKLEEDAFAVLGASDDINCTYNEGYVKRQALYACKTCSDKNNKSMAAICLACSYNCHTGHDLVELYTKRNFRCDCGNSLFGGKKCSLLPEKDSANVGNNYNQNFSGVYCTCARPYPDPDDTILDEMIQCIVCEDWYHTRHLNVDSSVLPGEDDYSEMICHFCTDRLSSFLRYYKGYSVSKIKHDSSSGDFDKDVSVVGDSVMSTSGSECQDKDGAGLKIKRENNIGSECEEKLHLSSSSGDAIVGINENENTVSASCRANSDRSISIDNQECKLKSFEKIDDELSISGASFWREDFRNVLCNCTSCLELYKSHGVSFLIDPLDTVQAYEDEGEKKRNRSRADPGQGGSALSGYEQGLKALSTLDRTKQVEAIHRYNEMHEHLKAYLKKFVENKKVVRAEDIKEFFSEMQSKKRQKVDMPYFCH